MLVVNRGSGRGKTSGVRVAHEGVALLHVRRGRVTRLVSYPEGRRALADLGLGE